LLERNGIVSWIDDQNNEGNMKVTIANAIRACRYFVVFLTANYNEKIAKGVDEKDWCFYEFNYATYAVRPKQILLVVLDPAMKGRSHWTSFIQAEFANRLYYYLTDA
jgi:hypothetical protein